jgi:general secretion pathway protein K
VFRAINEKTGQEGVALLVSLLVVVIMTVTVTEFLYSTWVERTFAVGFRDTTKALFALRSGVEASKRIIEDDLKNDMKNGHYVDSLKEVWAQSSFPIPLEDTYLFVSITDEASKINLNKLVDANGNPDDLHWIPVFRRLLRNLQLDENIAEYVRDWIDPNDEGPAEYPYYLSLAHPYKIKNGPLDTLEELKRVRGITPEVFNKIKNFVSVRPITTIPTVNINTAPPEVLLALADEMTPSLVDGILAYRSNAEFAAPADIKNVAGMDAIWPKISNLIDVKTNTFSVSATVTFNEVTRKADAMLAYRTTTTASTIYFRMN